MIGPSKETLDTAMNGDTKVVSGNKVDKQDVLYIHIQGTDYECRDCILFVKTEKCLIHHQEDKILATDSCGLFVYGRIIENARPLGIITKLQSGLTHSKNGFSCKRCKFFNDKKNDCSEVDKDSPGDDPGMISPDGCCNVWEALNA